MEDLFGKLPVTLNRMILAILALMYPSAVMERKYHAPHRLVRSKFYISTVVVLSKKGGISNAPFL
jgi:hypothetical protein